MKKQIIHTKFIPRIFAGIIDLTIISTSLSKIVASLSKYITIFFLRDFFEKYEIDTMNDLAITASLFTPEFRDHSYTSSVVLCLASCFALNLFFMGLYFIGFWYFMEATPGKLLMRMKIVDSVTYEKASYYKLLKRFFSYPTACFGILYILFSKNKRALHDKIAGTVVIKS